MNEYFVFNRIRCSVTDDKDVVLQGFCSEELSHDADALQIVVSGKNDEKVIPAKVVVSRAPLDKKNLFGSGKIVKTLSFIIKNCPKLSDEEKLSVIYNDSKNNQKISLYSCGEKEIKHYTKKLNACMDSVEADGKNIIIKGWAADSNEIKFKLVKIEAGKEEEIKYDLNRYTR